MSGVIIFFFILYHLLHFTFGLIHPQYFHLMDEQGRHDVYSMVVLSFRNIFIAGPYVAAMFVLCVHLSHGIQSLFQSFGLNSDGTKPLFKSIAHAGALIIFVGNSSIPLAAFFGFLKLPPGVM